MALPPGCPASIPAANGSCAPLGETCTYPQGSCWCARACGGCPPVTCAQLGLNCGTAATAAATLIQVRGLVRSTRHVWRRRNAGCLRGTPESGCQPKTSRTPTRDVAASTMDVGGTLDCSLYCGVWTCNLATPGCPVDAPALGSTCAPEGSLHVRADGLLHEPARLSAWPMDDAAGDDVPRVTL